MDDGEVDSFLDEILKNTRRCRHTHTCNPPDGPDTAHTHTCHHMHTQVIVPEDDNLLEKISKPRRPLGNREAVRKYREKKKAQTVFLEEEVKKLRVLNQQLVRKLQGQDVLEAEVLRLRGLLGDLRRDIDDELLGDLSLPKQCDTTASCFKEDDCGMVSISQDMREQCDTDFSCFDIRAEQSLEGNCQPAILVFRSQAE